MEKVFIVGKMEGNMLECIMKIRNKVLVLIIGQMADDFKANGKMAKEMEQARSSFLTVAKSMVFGNKINVKIYKPNNNTLKKALLL